MGPLDLACNDKLPAPIRYFNFSAIFRDQKRPPSAKPSDKELTKTRTGNPTGQQVKLNSTQKDTAPIPTGRTTRKMKTNAAEFI